MRRRAACAALLLATLAAAPGATRAQGRAAWPWASPLELYRAPAERVADVLGVEPFDPEGSLEALALKLVHQLDTEQTVDPLLFFSGLETRVSWGPVTLAHPELGIVLDRSRPSRPQVRSLFDPIPFAEYAETL